MTRIRDFLKRNNRLIAGVAAVFFVAGIALSHRIEPGVRVQKVTLADETPALKFIPAGPGPHPVALLAHGLTGSKETLFRYAEALTAAGFVCYAVDQPGHGESSRTFTVMDTVHTLEAVAREIGPVDVFVGHSLGNHTGGEAVREGGMRPGLFIAVGGFPALGDHAPPLLLLLGKWFEIVVTPELLKTRRDARLVTSPWCNHVFEMWDPVLVNAAVEGACALVHKTPPPPTTAWLWRIVGIVLAILGAGTLALYLPEFFPQLARVRGLLFAVLFIVSFALTVGYAWLDTAPHLRFFPRQGASMAVILLLALIAGRLRIPRWCFTVLGVLVMVMAFCWWKASGTRVAQLFTIFTFAFTPVLVLGTAIGWFASLHGSRLQGDIAIAIVMGCGVFQFFELPPKPPETPPKRHMAIKLAPEQYEDYVGEYRFPPDNLLSSMGVKLRIWRLGDQLRGQTPAMNHNHAFAMYPESETNFFADFSSSDFITRRPSIENGPQQFTFVKNDLGETTAVIIHGGPGLPDSEGKKVAGVANGAKDAATVDPADYDCLVGKYDFGKKARLTVTRVGNQLFAQFAGRNCEIFPRSETEYFWKVMDAQVTFVNDDRGKVTKAIFHQGSQTIVGTKIVSELSWLSSYGRWFGAAALLYAFCIGVSIRDRLPFQIMREFFQSLPRNFAGCFKGWNIAWHFVAIGLGVVLVTSGFDWFYLSATRSPQLLAWMIPGIDLGVWVPLTLPPSLLLAGLAFKRANITRTGWALAQVALIGFVLTELIKAITGRPQPPRFIGPDTSHVFHFGFLRSEIVSGWPSGHTIIAFATSITLFCLLPQKRWLGAVVLLYAFYIGLSVSMTIHWFADFASGIIFGIVVGTTVGRSFAAMDFPSRGNGVQNVPQVTSRSNV